jgi:[NiFe] hydrogenase assembly HybE family chaperone
MPSSAESSCGSPLSERVQAAFQRVLEQRMTGMSLVNPALAVEVIGFRRVAGASVGVVITPWAMNLVRFPDGDVLAEGSRGSRQLPVGLVDFIGAHEDELGAFESASLFSPMFEFSEQAIARAVAFEVLRTVLSGANDAVKPRAELPRPAPGPLQTTGANLQQDFDRRAVLRGQFLNDGSEPR